MRRRAGRTLIFVAVFCATAGFPACTPPTPEATPAQRLIEPEPERLLDLQTRARLAAGHLEEMTEATTGGPPGSWRVAEAGELRSAILTAAGAPRRWDLRLPPGARLRFACSPAAIGSRAGVARVRIESESGQDEVIFETETETSEPGWQEADVDLASFADSPVRLVFETQPSQDETGTLVSAWADPVVSARGAPAAPRPGPNIVLVSIDTLRADHLSLYGYPRETSPHLDRWARERGVVFEETVAPSPWTLPSHVSLFTGQDALRHGVNYLAPAPAEIEMLAETLRARGYRTVAVTDGGYMHPRFGLAQGFDVYRFEYDSDRRERLPEAMDRLLEWLGLLSAGDAPYLLFFHTYAVHEPYWAREPWLARFSGETPTPPDSPLRAETREQPMRPEEGFRGHREYVLFDESGHARSAGDGDLARIAALYDSGIAHLDDQLARLLAALDDPAVAPNTWIVLTSDHGESLGEHGFAGHGHLYDDTLLVPLVMAGPNLVGGRRVHTPVRLVDVAPTLLGLLQPSVTSDAVLDGRSLAPLLAGDETGPARDAFAAASIVNLGVALRTAGGLKYIHQDSPRPTELPRDELYVLGEDPKEFTNRARQDPRTADLARRVGERLSGRSAPLRIEAFNAGRPALEGTLTGHGIHVATVKTDADTADVEWRGAHLSWRVAPGASWRLAVFGMGPSSGELHGEIGRPGEPARAFRLTPDAAEAEQVVGFSGDALYAGSASAAPSLESGLRFSFQAPAAAAAGTSDPHLEHELRALGYVR